jgi:hypothetical protein
MILVWKFPEGVNIDDVRQLQGTEGSRLNPIQDAEGNWIVSDEEYCMAEFQYLKKDYPQIWAGMTRIEYRQKPQPPIGDEG